MWEGRTAHPPTTNRDARYGDRFTQLRKEIFGDNFPASALITVAGLARPEMLVEVQGIAVLG